MPPTGTIALSPLPSPPVPPVSADTTISGKLRPAISVIQLFSSDEWEEFILEWADSLRKQYHEVGRFAGSGDMGRDICAFYGSSGTLCDWDNFQCKHYDHALAPTDIWVELGKLCYYTHIGMFSVPKNYYFVAPKGCGSKLSTLLQKPDQVRRELISQWPKYCENQIRASPTPLDGALLNAVQSFDFSIVKPLSVLKVIEQHKQTQWHVARFGAGLPPRPEPPAPPVNIAAQEARYVEQLFEAYSDHLRVAVTPISGFGSRPDLKEHFQRSREQFYYAEALRAFSRDTLPPGQFERLQKDIFDGVVDVTTGTHQDGLERLRATIKQSLSLQITSHALAARLFQNDRCGICHQLANTNKLLWVT